MLILNASLPSIEKVSCSSLPRDYYYGLYLCDILYFFLYIKLILYSFLKGLTPMKLYLIRLQSIYKIDLV